MYYTCYVLYMKIKQSVKCYVNIWMRNSWKNWFPNSSSPKGLKWEYFANELSRVISHRNALLTQSLNFDIKSHSTQWTFMMRSVYTVCWANKQRVRIEKSDWTSDIINMLLILRLFDLLKALKTFLSKTSTCLLISGLYSTLKWLQFAVYFIKFGWVWSEILRILSIKNVWSIITPRWSIFATTIVSIRRPRTHSP
jgi:hypothetical protein